MVLPGRLDATTLGDVLGTLHRARSTGTLELREPHGRVHRVHLSRGRVTAVEVDRASASLAEILRRRGDLDEETLRRSLLAAIASRRLHGEVLVADFHLAPSVVGSALRRQALLRLQMLEELRDAALMFRVTLRPPRGALVDEPLAGGEFLAGRKRARDRYASASAARNAEFPKAAPLPSKAVSARALMATRVLGVPADADALAIKRAYRNLARAYHPDLHPEATHDERKRLALKFTEVTEAYRAALVA